MFIELFEGRYGFCCIKSSFGKVFSTHIHFEEALILFKIEKMQRHIIRFQAAIFPCHVSVTGPNVFAQFLHLNWLTIKT